MPGSMGIESLSEAIMRLKNPADMTREELEYRFASGQKDVTQAQLDKAEQVARAYRAVDQGQFEALEEARRNHTLAVIYADEAWHRYFGQITRRAGVLLAEEV